MSRPLFERYKDALRRGHVAALDGRLDAALTAYEEAAELAPDRALPHVSLGSILGRLGRPAEALAAYDRALFRAPLDEAGLRGRITILLALGRRVEAADDLERLAEALEAEGRLAEASEAARRSLEVAESRPRRRLADRLAATLHAGDPGPVAPAVADAEDVDAADDAGPQVTPPSVAETETPPVDAGALVAEAETLLEAGDVGEARPRLLAAAAAHRAAGRADAAFDACFLLLAAAPDDPELTLLLADLQLDEGWRGPAIDKLHLLERLTELAEDQASVAAVRAATAARLADLERPVS